MRLRRRSASAAAALLVEANDLHEAGAPAALMTAVKRAGGRLDILVNNAGATKRGHFLALSDDDWRDGYGVKFFAHVRLARVAWPLLKASGGSLVTIAGISGKEPEAEFTIGSSVNAACIAFTKALADLGKADGVQVNAISPGRVETERLWRRIRERVRKHRRERGQGARRLPAGIGHHPLRAHRGYRRVSSPSWSRRTAAGCTVRPSTWTAAKSGRCDSRVVIPAERVAREPGPKNPAL